MTDTTPAHLVEKPKFRSPRFKPNERFEGKYFRKQMRRVRRTQKPWPKQLKCL